jgi:hypothetical protein
MNSNETNPQGVNPDLRSNLLSQQQPSGVRLEAYRKEVAAMLDQNEVSLRRERKFTGIMWVYLVLLCTGFMVIGGLRPNTSLGVWFGVMAVFWLLFGAVFLLKYFINQTRVETLKEVKKVELEVMELKELLSRR